MYKIKVEFRECPRYEANFISNFIGTGRLWDNHFLTWNNALLMAA